MNYFNTLPHGYTTWYSFMEWYKKQEHLTASNTGNVSIAYGNRPDRWDINIDYAKARAFEEIGTVPDVDELRMLYRLIQMNAGFSDHMYKPQIEFINRLTKLQLEK